MPAKIYIGGGCDEWLGKSTENNEKDGTSLETPSGRQVKNTPPRQRRRAGSVRKSCEPGQCRATETGHGWSGHFRVRRSVDVPYVTRPSQMIAKASCHRGSRTREQQRGGAHNIHLHTLYQLITDCRSNHHHAQLPAKSIHVCGRLSYERCCSNIQTTFTAKAVCGRGSWIFPRPHQQTPAHAWGCKCAVGGANRVPR